MNDKKLKIAEFRDAVCGLNWTRNDLYSATESEIVRINVRARLENEIAKVKVELELVPAGFNSDIEKAHEAIKRAEGYIARWEEKVLAYFMPTANVLGNIMPTTSVLGNLMPSVSILAYYMPLVSVKAPRCPVSQLLH